jgi:hypothetical protein
MTIDTLLNRIDNLRQSADLPTLPDAYREGYDQACHDITRLIRALQGATTDPPYQVVITDARDSGGGFSLFAFPLLAEADPAAAAVPTQERPATIPDES